MISIIIPTHNRSQLENRTWGKQKRISILIPTYNRKEVLLRNIRSLEEVKDDIEIVIVDDFSKDGTKEEIEKYMKNTDMKIKFIRNTENKGVIEAVNIGINEATYDFIFMIADDTFITKPKETIRILKMYQDKNFIIATRLIPSYHKEGILYFLYEAIVGCLAGEVFDYAGKKKRTVRYCNGILGFNRKTGIKFCTKSYIHNYFRTESDLQVNARKKGIKILYYPEIEIYHEMTNYGGIRIDNKKSMTNRYIYNHIIFLRRNFGFTKYYKLPFYFLLSIATHPQLTFNIMQTFDKAFKTNLSIS